MNRVAGAIAFAAGPRLPTAGTANAGGSLTRVPATIAVKRSRLARLALFASLLLAFGAQAEDATESGIRAIVAAGELAELRWPSFPDYRPWLERFYGPDAHAPAWFVNGMPRKQAKDAVTLLADAASKGLDPADYDAALLESRLGALERGPAPPTERAWFDTALTVAMLRYVSDLHRGKINPRNLGWGLDVEPKKYDLALVLRDAIARDRLAAAIAAAEPQLTVYARLKTALAAYRTLAGDTTLQPVPEVAKLEPGQAYAGAAALAHRLLALGDLPRDGPATAPDRYDRALVDAVKRFQDRHGLSPDGVVGQATFAELNTPLTRRVRQLEFGLERLRWLPELPSSAIVAVNVPSFTLWAVQDPNRFEAGDLEMKVVVGRAARTRTPIFMQNMSYVEFSPYWNVPPSIVRDETLPRLKRDRGYLEREQMEFVAPDLRVTTDVNPDALAALAAGRLRVRQRPGPKNALGGVKFVLPNAMNIYMHGTPAQTLFERTRRDFSHGCIRVADPAALTRFVLADKPEWIGERIKEAMESGQMATVKLTRPIPVIIFYSTVVADRRERVLFPPDIYGLDSVLEHALAAGYPYPA